MGLAIAIALAVLALAALIRLGRAPRGAWEAVAAALVFGLAGFAFQAHPDQTGAPKAAAADTGTSGAAMVAARREMNTGGPTSGDRWMIPADALARQGQFADAAGMALGAVEQNPNNADAWLAVANNLVAHAEGRLTPAALYAYDRARKADPAHPGPPYFLGLALAQNGLLSEGRTMWADLLARSPPDAPWRQDLAARLADLDQFIAKQAAIPPR